MKTTVLAVLVGVMLAIGGSVATAGPFEDASAATGEAPAQQSPPASAPKVNGGPTVLQWSPSASAVSMVLQGGTYRVPVLINGAMTLEFIVDSGASHVTIPADVVRTLMRTGTLKSSDFFGEQTYRQADGSEVSSQTFRIRSLKVGNNVIENVTASVTPSQGFLLLGQSFLERFKSWSIDNAKHELVLKVQ